MSLSAKPFSHFLASHAWWGTSPGNKETVKTTPQNPPKQTLQHISLFWRENRDMGTLSHPAHAPTHPQSGRSEVEWQHSIRETFCFHPHFSPSPPSCSKEITFLKTWALLLVNVLSILYGTGGFFSRVLGVFFTRPSFTHIYSPQTSVSVCYSRSQNNSSWGVSDYQ